MAAPDEPLGLTAFDRLRAEHEPWLLACFAPPPDFDFMAGGRSAAVIGEAGAGKTALARALMARAHPRNLIVEWRPESSPGALTPWEDSRSQFEAILALGARALVHRLVREPARYTGAAGWVQDAFGWFIRRCLADDAPARLLLLADAPDDPGRQLTERLLAPEGAPVDVGDVSAMDAANLLLQALRRVDLDGIWVFADGLGAQWATAEMPLERSLRAFLATLPLLQMTGYTYKILTPTELQDLVIESEAVQRSYMDIYRLDWGAGTDDGADGLREIVERRLALATGQADFPLAALCAAPEFQPWLRRLGGNSPLGWLTTVKPLVAEYLRAPGEARCPLSTKQWQEISRRQTIRVRMAADDSVIVGWRVIRGLGETELKVLECLLAQRNRYVSRDELHRYVFPKDAAPGPGERGTIDTALWRLRKEVEPFPGRQSLIVSARNAGVCLKAA